jgi:hypothetical protein
MSTAGWKGLKYFDYESQHLVVATDGAWKGGRVVPTLSIQRPLTVNGPGLRETGPRWLWATTCGSAPQFVSFTRLVRAPGVPREGSLELNLGFGRDLPFRSGEFLVNGKEVARIVVKPGKTSGFPQTFSGPLTAKALKAFNYGANTLTIRAERKALPKGERCNTKNRVVGLYASLSLRFSPDVVAAPSTLGLAQVVTVFGPYSGQMIFRNRGPSGSAGGTFVFGWSSQYVEPVIGTASISGGVRNCKAQGAGEVYGTIECEYGDLPVGKVLTVGFRGLVRQLDNWTPRSVGDLSHTWELRPAGGDVFASNNDGSHTVLFCGAQATDSRCKK